MVWLCANKTLFATSDRRSDPAKQLSLASSPDGGRLASLSAGSPRFVPTKGPYEDSVR